MKNKVKKEFNRFKRRIKLLFRIINSSEIRSLPSSLAYYLILSFFPLIALLGYISSLFNVSVDSVINVFKDTSIELSGFLNTIINKGGVPFNTAIYAITALILSANGAYSIVVTSNELYHVKEKKIISRRVKSLFFILILISVFLFTILF
jgi:membrane protein